jgi:DNA-binding transcriptional ArsR family regulator
MIEIIGSQVRTEILRLLSLQPCTAVDLADALGVAHSSVHRHLVVLEGHGLIATDVESGHRRGQRTVTWCAVPSKVGELGRRWAAYASGE